jgi:beta-N-acetylhexosaminidase
MIGHLLLPFLDPVYPATLSPILHQTLRDAGFSGLIVTDDMGMIESDYTRKDALKQALLAGNDLLLYVDPGVREAVIDDAIQIVKA